MSNDLEVLDEERFGENFSPASVFDVARFESIMRVADVMARATTIPDHLKGQSQDRDERFEETRGNCFMICNQADHWGMDPFQVAQATAFVYGKFCYEGKLIRAVIKKKLGFDLSYAIFGKPGDMDRCVYVSDKPLVDSNGSPFDQDQIIAAMQDPSSGFKITTGTFRKWHTKAKGGGVNDNWARDEEKMFRERGSREWCRQYAPGLMLGVYTPDEFDEVEQTSRSNRARDVSSAIASNPLLADDRNNRVSMNIDSDREAVSRSESAESRSAVEASQGSGDNTDSAKAAEAAGRKASAGQSSSEKAQSDPPSDGAGGDASAVRVSPSLFSEFAVTLLRFDTEEKIEKGSNQFWNAKGGKPDHSADVALAKSIIRTHFDRCKNNVAIEEVKAALDAAISKSFEL